MDSSTELILNAFNDAIMTIRESNEKRYLKVQEAPEYLNISEDTFTKWRKAGLVTPIVIEGVKRFDRYDLDAVMANHKITV